MTAVKESSVQGFLYADIFLKQSGNSVLKILTNVSVPPFAYIYWKIHMCYATYIHILHTYAMLYIYIYYICYAIYIYADRSSQPVWGERKLILKHFRSSLIM